MNKQTRGISEIFVLIALALFVVIGIGYYAYKNGQIKFTPTQKQVIVSPTPTSTTDEIENWDKYTNSEYNYQLNYPTGWEVSTFGNDNVNTASGILIRRKCNYDNGERCQQLFINTGIAYFDTYELEDYLSINTDSKWPEKLIRKEQTTLDETSALKYEIFSNEFYGSGINDWGLVIVKLLAIKDKKVYMLTYKEMGKDQSSIKTSNDWSDKKSFDQILSTFKFLD